MLTNKDVLRIAMAQSAEDIGCSPQDFLQAAPVIVDGVIGQNARSYYKEPIPCNLVSYGNNVVASVKPAYRAIVAEYLQKFTFYHCFETPNLHWLGDRLAPFGQKPCFMAQYFLPDAERLQPLPVPGGYTCRLLTGPDFAGLYLDAWSNALSAARPHLDVLGVGAYDSAGALVGLAACSADCDTMWQIGVDVLPQHRRRGLAAALVSRLGCEILQRGRVPFYCCAWSNLRSIKTALKSGFAPAWVELTVKPADIVDGMNEN